MLVAFSMTWLLVVAVDHESRSRRRRPGGVVVVGRRLPFRRLSEEPAEELVAAEELVHVPLLPRLLGPDGHDDRRLRVGDLAERGRGQVAGDRRAVRNRRLNGLGRRGRSQIEARRNHHPGRHGHDGDQQRGNECGPRSRHHFLQRGEHPYPSVDECNATAAPARPPPGGRGASYPSGTISACRGPVTAASAPSTYTLISVRTPKSSR